MIAHTSIIHKGTMHTAKHQHITMQRRMAHTAKHQHITMQRGIKRTSSNNVTVGVNSKRHVSFHPYTQVVEFWPVLDPAIKNQLYYSPYDLFLMKQEAKLALSYWFAQRKHQLRNGEQHQLHYRNRRHHQQQQKHDTTNDD